MAIVKTRILIFFLLKTTITNYKSSYTRVFLKPAWGDPEEGLLRLRTEKNWEIAPPSPPQLTLQVNVTEWPGHGVFPYPLIEKGSLFSDFPLKGVW